MPYLVDLADACRKSGLAVEERPNWRTRGHGEMAGVRTISCHHTAGPKTGECPSLNIVTNGRSDLPGPLSHLVLGRSGKVYVVAAGLCYHAGATFLPIQSNSWSIGIEAEHDGVSAWPTVQYNAYARLCKALADHYVVPYSSIYGHKEIAKPKGRKIDPNFDMDRFRRDVGALGRTSTNAGNVTVSKGASEMQHDFPVPDYYTDNPKDTMWVSEAIAWGTRHAAKALDATARIEKKLDDLSARLSALEKK